MATETQLLQDLAVVLGTAGLTAVVFKRFGLPLVFGFLVAGVAIGPHTPPFQLVEDEASINTLAELGVVLLLFGLGLDFNFRRLRRIGGVSFVVMATEVLLMFWLGYELGRLLGWDQLDSIFLGAMISISSTAIIVKVLRELGRLNEPSSQIVFGVLVLEDVAAILTLVLLSGYAATGDLAFGTVGIVLVQMLLFLLATILLGLLLVPRLIDWIARRGTPEILIITVLGLGFGFAVLSDLANFHVGLGAFLMGAVIAEARSRETVEQSLRPVHDVFAAIFFVSIGMLVDFSVIQQYWVPILAIFGLIVVGKLMAGALATLLVGYPSTVAVSVGAALAQMGEFSFVIAALGLQAGVTSDFLFPVIVGAAALTSLTAPLMIRHSHAIGRSLGRAAPAPLRTYARIYSAWMSSLRQRSAPAQQAKRVKARRSIILSGIVFTAIVGAAWLFQDRGKALLADRGFGDPGLALTYWGLTLAVALPILVRFFQSVNRWIATWEMPDSGRKSLGFRRVVRGTLYFIGLVLVGLPFVAATAPFIRTPVVALAWVAMVASGAVILWASITRLHSRIETNVQALLDDEQVPVDAPRVVRDLMTADFPWEIRVDTFTLEARTWAAGKRLGEIDLRGATGASLLLIERGETRQETPGPETVLLPGDGLTLMGTREQLSSARAVLSRPAPPSPRGRELRLGRLYVAETSELDGARLSDAMLPTKHGLQIVAILRENRAIPNPGAHERLRPGDIVLVLGAQEQIAAATALAGPRPPASSQA